MEPDETQKNPLAIDIVRGLCTTTTDDNTQKKKQKKKKSGARPTRHTDTVTEIFKIRWILQYFFGF